jgi:hypothetical protein
VQHARAHSSATRQTSLCRETRVTHRQHYRELDVLHVLRGSPARLLVATESAFGALYTNDNKAELMIVVTVVICRLTQKYAQMQHPLFGIMPVILVKLIMSCSGSGVPR